ncbi:MAG: MFS transporter, partial [Thermodesulfobacteriota bacterium]
MPWKEYHKVWGVMIFGWIANYMVRSGLAPVLIPIRQEMNLTYAQAGWIASALFYAYAGMLFPAGHLGDRFGRKMVLVVCTFWWAVSSVLTGFAESFAALFLFRFLTGLGQGSYFSNDRPIISHYTPKEKQGFGQSFSFIGLGTGMFLGYVLAGLISSSLGWRYVFYFFSLPSFAAGILILKYIKEPKSCVSNSSNSRPQVPYSILFKKTDLWMLYIGGIPGVYAVWMAGTWGPAIFQELGVGTLAASSVLSGLIGISAIPGLLMTGWISDIMVKNNMGRKGLIGAQFCAIALLMLLMGAAIRLKWSPYWGAVIIFCIGFFAWGHWGAFYALISDIVPHHIQGTCYGFTNSVNFIGALIAPPMTGWI